MDVDRIVVGLNPVIGSYDMLDNEGMRKSQKRQGQGEVYMKLHSDRIEIHELGCACEFLNCTPYVSYMFMRVFIVG